MATTQQLIRMIDRLGTGHKIDRREVVQAMATLGLGVTALPLVSPSARAAESIAYFSWSGYEVRELHPGFIETYGEGSVTATFFGTEEEALAKLRQNFRADIAHPCSYSMPHWIDAGVAGPIDVSRLSNWPDLFPPLRELPDTMRNGEHYMVPFDWGSSSVLYRSDLVDPKYVDDPTWAILYDEAYAGRLAMYDTSVMVDIAMLVNGHDDIASFTDAELEAVRPLLEKGNSLVRFYWTHPTDVTHGLASGELVAAYAWNGMTKPLVEQGVPVTYMNPKEGQFAWVCGLTIDPRSQADPAMVYTFIDAMISPEAGVFEIEVYDYGHANMKAFEQASPEALKRLSITDPIAVFDRSNFIPALPVDLEAKITALADEIKADL